MEISVLQRVRDNLLEKRNNLSSWLQTTPNQKKEVNLGPAGEVNLQEHLHVLDNAITLAADESLGTCEICEGYIGDELVQLDYTACVCIDHLSYDEARQLEQELELSQTVQRALLPHQSPQIPGLDVAVFSRPAQIVGGDYFDFFQFRDGAYALAIADVAGHGMAASLLMASMMTALHTITPETEYPSEVVRRVNRFFSHNVNFTTFVTLFLGRFDPDSKRLLYCNAGHNPPLLVRHQPNGHEPVVWLKPTGAAVGLIEDYSITASAVKLDAGDTLLLYTDGITEANNPSGEMFGETRLAELVRNQAKSPAKELVRLIWQEVQDFLAGQAPVDDATLVALKLF